MRPVGRSDQLVVECSGVTRRYVIGGRGSAGSGSEVLALQDVDLEVPAGLLLALAGPSGSGKSTLLALLGALDRPTSGALRVDGVDVATLGRRERRAFRRRRAVSMLPLPADSLLLDLTGRENVVAAGHHRGLLGDVRSRADELLAEMELDAFADRPCALMSGGEQQRIALAASLIGSSAVVLADEPTGALDRAGAATVAAALRGAVERGASIVVATHDPNIEAVADMVVRLDHGRRVL